MTRARGRRATGGVVRHAGREHAPAVRLVAEDAAGDEAAVLRLQALIVGAMQHEGRRAHGRQHVADVEFTRRPNEEAGAMRIAVSAARRPM